MRRFLDMFALASAVALSVISCAKESDNHVNDGQKNRITITASLPDELVTKVKFEVRGRRIRHQTVVGTDGCDPYHFRNRQV